MSLTTKDIPWLWKNGQRGKAAAMSTDGTKLYSYNLVIGTTINGRKVLYDYRSPHCISMTTSHHVSKSTMAADEIVAPPEKKETRL